MHDNQIGKPCKLDDVNDPGVSVRRWFYNESGADLVLGASVIIDVAGLTYGPGGSIVIMPATAVGGQQFIGICAEAIPNGSGGEVVVYGTALLALTDGCAQGDILTADLATAGMLDTSTGLALEDWPCAVAITADVGGGTATVFVLGRGA